MLRYAAMIAIRAAVTRCYAGCHDALPMPHAYASAAATMMLLLLRRHDSAPAPRYERTLVAIHIASLART